MIFKNYFISLIITAKITYTMSQFHNHPIIEVVMKQITETIKRWLIKRGEDRVFKFNFGVEASWYIARIGLTLPAIDYIVKTIQYDKFHDITDYTYEIENDERILTLYFD